MACDYQAIRRDNVRRYGTDIERIGPMLLSDRYDDRTHFIYELLQNAEDALAKRVGWCGRRSVCFDLSERELRVNHFGKPFDEADVRGVCGILEGTKETDLTRIGRFGIGFKSVYVFTDRPEVHSGNEDFAVEKYVWPAAAPEIPRARDETVIVMPLREPADHGVIEDGLKRLGSDALLFLHEIEKIKWSVNGGDSGLYLRQSEKLDEHVHRIMVSGQTDGQQDTEESWLTFSHPINVPSGKEVGQVEVAFRMNKNGQVVPVSRSPLFVFFPTVVETSLRFYVQGPFRTTPSRDNVPSRNDWNRRCVQELAKVLVNALTWLREAELLDVNVFRCLPLDPEKFDESMFEPLFKQTKHAIATRHLLPRSDGGHIAAEGAMLARTRETRELFDSRQLNRLFGGDRTFAWLSGDISQDRTPELRRYLTDQLGVTEITPSTILRKLDVAFLGDESDEWVRRLYEFLNGQSALWNVAADLPLIRIEDGTHVQPRSDGRLQAFLPGQLETKFPTVRATVCDSEPSQAFLRGLGLTEPDPVADVIENTLPKYREDEREVTADEEYDADVRRILRAFKSDSIERRSALIAELRQTPFVMAVDAGDASRRFAKPEQLHLATERLKSLYSGVAGVYLVDDECSCLRGDDVRELLEACGAVRYMRPIRDYSIDYAARCELRKSIGHEHTSGRNDRVADWTLERLDVLLGAFPGLTIEDKKLKARQLWSELANLRERRGKSIFRAKYSWTHYGAHSAEYDAAFVRKLNETEWVPDPVGNLQRPELILFDGLDWPSDPFLQSKIRFKPPIIDELAAEAGIDPEVLYLLKKRCVTKEQLIGWLGSAEMMNMETEPDGSATVTKGDRGTPNGGGRGGDGVSGGSGGSGRRSGERPPGSARKRSFISYVAVHPDGDVTDPDQLQHADRMALEEKAISFILKQEPGWRRTPPHNPGYDLFQSGHDDAPVSWCEVKAMTGSLEDRPVGMSSVQFDCARDHRKDYWLYVVESAGTDDARIVRIQDPAGKARTFTFDRGWRDVSEIDS